MLPYFIYGTSACANNITATIVKDTYRIPMKIKVIFLFHIF